MSTTIRISEKNKELVDDISGQLHTSRKEVVDMIFTWFFSQAGPDDLVDVVEDEALEVVDEADILDEDEEEEEEE